MVKQTMGGGFLLGVTHFSALDIDNNHITATPLLSSALILLLALVLNLMQSITHDLATASTF